MIYSLKSAKSQLNFLLIVIILCQLCVPAFSAVKIETQKRTIKAKPVFKVSLPKFKKTTDLQLPISQIAQRLPMAATGNTNLKMRRDSGEFHNEFSEWNVDWHDKGAKNLKFGWKSKDKNIQYAAWQVTTVRYPSGMKDWSNPPGLVATGDSPIPTGSSSAAIFYVDLSAFAPPAPVLSLQPKIDISKIKKQINKITNTSPSKSVKFAPTKLLKNIDTVKNMNKSMTAITFYVRVIPLNNKKQPISKASNIVHINYGDFKQGPVTIYPVDPSKPNINPAWPTLTHPDVNIAEYQPIRERQPGASYHFVVIRDVPMMYSVGDKLDFTPHKDDKSWWEKIGDWISDVISFVESAVNWVSNAYQSIKNFAVSWAPDWMQGPLLAGLNIGLAALGIPPELPDFGDLSNMGKDYLVKAAAGYAGLPPEETGKAVDMFIDAAKSAQDGGGGNSAVWMKPDPDYFYRSAYVIADVSNNSDKATDPMHLYVGTEVVGDEDAKKYSEPLYHTKASYLPSLAPGESVKVPIFLEEYTQYRQFDTDIQAGIHRFWIRYHSKPVKFVISTSGERNSQNSYQMQETITFDKAYSAYTAQ